MTQCDSHKYLKTIQMHTDGEYLANTSQNIDKARKQIEGSVVRSDYSDSDSSYTAGEKKRYKCTFSGCKARFSKNRKLITHLRRHNGERPFTCDESGCTKSYTNSSHLRRHKKTAHVLPTKYVFCQREGCGQKFTNESNLKRHINRKHNEKRFPFNCKECPMGFTKKNRLLKHEYIHTGKPAFRCDVCGTFFTDEYRLNKHEHNHKSYSCSCGNQFGIWSVLLQHKRTCKTELTCKVCSKVFANKANLKSHYFTHDDEKRAEYICGHENCNRKYEFKKNLVQHIKTTHMPNIQRIPCPHDGCTADFKSKLCLKRHLELHKKTKVIRAKRPRKPRQDKGKPTKSMASILSGVDLTHEENRSIINGQMIDLPTCLITRIKDSSFDKVGTSQKNSVDAVTSNEKESIVLATNSQIEVIGKAEQPNRQVKNLSNEKCMLEHEDERSKSDLCTSDEFCSCNNDELLRYTDQSLQAIERQL